MVIDTLIMNREMVELYSLNESIIPSLIISITDFHAKHPKFNKNNKNIIDILKLNFDDVYEDENYCITDEDADKIRDFVKKYINSNFKGYLILQCDGGVSRSAAVSAALNRFYTNDEMSIFENPEFCPNHSVYFKILDSFKRIFKDFNYKKDEEFEKFKLNVKIWREYRSDWFED